MIIIRSPADIIAVKMPKHVSEYVSKLLAGIMRLIPDFNEDDGMIVVAEPKDTDEILCEKLGSQYSDNIFEGVSYIPEYRVFHLVYMTNNQHTVSLILCEPWLDDKMRSRVNNELA